MGASRSSPASKSGVSEDGGWGTAAWVIGRCVALPACRSPFFDRASKAIGNCPHVLWLVDMRLDRTGADGSARAAELDSDPKP